MNANRLLSITIENQIDLSAVLEYLEIEAKQGRSEALLRQYLPTELISDIAQLGIRIQKTQNSFSETVYLLSWS